MRLIGVLVVSLVILGSPASTQDARSVVDAVARAIGAPGIGSIQYSGTGYVYGFGQSYQPGGPWVKFNLKSYTLLTDYERAATREDQVRTYLDPPERGGTAVFIGELRQVSFLSGDVAWNAGPDGAAAPAPLALDARQLQLPISPHGFVKAAMAAAPTAVMRTIGGRRLTVVSFTWKGKYTVNGYVNGQNLLERVETWMPDPLLGDMLVENVFSDYRDVAGIKFPGRIVQRHGGFPVLDVTVGDVQPNAPAAIEVPDAARRPGPPVGRVEVVKVADGVWLLVAPVGPNSLVVEFRDHVAIVEAPFSEERSLAVLAEVKQLVPGKPVRYLINTHHHFDHSSGIRTYVAEGVTIITHRGNTDFYNRVFKLPHTLSPDRLSQNPKPARFETLTDRYVLTDGTRSLELHLLEGNTHNPGLLLVYLPRERLLHQADAFTAPPPGAPLPPATNMVNARNLNLAANIDRLRLQVDRITAAHGRVMPLADLWKAIGRAN
ncbi:MAG: MBL fold metallo-hydrolase [Acidobacteria bacterium]|nr:MBL fold metallo-hydrolase [Acidobacteriota bacterium]